MGRCLMRTNAHLDNWSARSLVTMSATTLRIAVLPLPSIKALCAGTSHAAGPGGGLPKRELAGYIRRYQTLK
jgi:hypothetical protein